MRTAPLGQAGFDVTRIVAGAGRAPLPVARGVALLDEGWELGIRSIDVADAAGTTRQGGDAVGASGNAVDASGERTESAAPKTPPTGTRDGDIAAARFLDDRQPDDAVLLAGIGAGVGRLRGSDLSADGMTREIRTAAHRLGRLDAVWIRGADTETPLEATLTPLAEAIEAGRIRAWGASDVNVWELEALLTAADRSALPRPSFIRSPLHLLHRVDERDLLPLAIGEGLGFLARKPFAGGRLTDRHIDEQEAEERRTRAGEARVVPYDESLPGLLALRHLARERGVSTSGLALAWLLLHPQVSATIVAARSGAEWEGVGEALATDLDPEEVEQIGDLLA